MNIAYCLGKKKNGFTPTPDLRRRSHRTHERGFKFQNKDQVWGFTLLETIVAIGILTTGILSVVALMSYNLNQANALKNRVIATSLAEEGIEVMRNIRDTNWLQGRQFNDWDQDNTNQAINLRNKLKAAWGSYGGYQNVLAVAPDGNIYIGANGGKFGRYTPNTDTFLDLTGKITGFWGDNDINAFAIDTTNNTLYLGGDEGRFAYCSLAVTCNTVINFSNKLAWGNIPVFSLAFDSLHSVIYLGGLNGYFAKCEVANPCDGSDGNAPSLTSPVVKSLFPGGEDITSMAVDATHTNLFLVGGGRLVQCRIGPGECTDEASPSTGIDISSKLRGYAVTGFFLNPIDNTFYFGAEGGGAGGYFFKCHAINLCDSGGGDAIDLTSKISGFWGSSVVSDVLSLTLDSTNNTLYLGGAQGQFARCTINQCANEGSGVNADNLTGQSGFEDLYPILALAFDPTGGKIFLGGTENQFSHYDIASGTATPHHNLIRNRWGKPYAGNQTATIAVGGYIFIGTDDGKFGKYDPELNRVLDLTPKLNAVAGFEWSTVSISSLVFDAANDTLYLAGQGKFAYCTIGAGECSDETSGVNAVDLSTKITALPDAFRWNSSSIAMGLDQTNRIIYLGTFGGFAKYNIPSEVLTSLSHKLTNFIEYSNWVETSEIIVHHDANPINDAVYLSGFAGRFAKCSIGTGRCTDAASGVSVEDLGPKISPIYGPPSGATSTYSMALDANSNDLYLGADRGILVKCRLGPGLCGDATATGVSAEDLSSKIGGGDGILSMAILNNTTLYLGDRSPKFVKCEIGTCTDPSAPEQAVDLSNKIYDNNGNFWRWNRVSSLSIDVPNNTIYLAGSRFNFAKCDITIECYPGTADECNAITPCGRFVRYDSDDAQPQWTNGLYYNAGNRAYEQSWTSEMTLFTRRIMISDNPDGDYTTDDVQVKSNVTWIAKGRTNEVQIEERLYDWK